MRNKKDSRTKSAIESILDVIIGFTLYLPVNYFILPLFVDGIAEYSIVTMLSVSIIYTGIALIRKFVLRRWFVSKPQIFSKV